MTTLSELGSKYILAVKDILILKSNSFLLCKLYVGFGDWFFFALCSKKKKKQVEILSPEVNIKLVKKKKKTSYLNCKME